MSSRSAICGWHTNDTQSIACCLFCLFCYIWHSMGFLPLLKFILYYLRLIFWAERLVALCCDSLYDWEGGVGFFVSLPPTPHALRLSLSLAGDLTQALKVAGVHPLTHSWRPGPAHPLQIKRRSISMCQVCHKATPLLLKPLATPFK